MDFLTVMPMVFLSSEFKVMALQLGDYDDKYLTWIGSIGTIANGASRIIMGALSDKLDSEYITT